MGEVAYGIFGLLLIGGFGWAIVSVLRGVANAVGQHGSLAGLVAQLRYGSPGQRRAHAERRLQPFEERLSRPARVRRGFTLGAARGR